MTEVQVAWTRQRRRQRVAGAGGWLLVLLLAGAGCGGSYGGPAAAGPASEPNGAIAPQARIRDLGAAEAYSFLQSRGDAIVLDVRLPPEWDDDLGHLDFARQIPVQELEYRVDELPADKDRPILVYCRNGLRSSQATQILAKHGYLEIYTILGGLEAYRQAGY